MQNGEKRLSLWYDHNLTPGRDWEIEARRYIYDFNCKGVIFFLSENAVLSQSIHKEIEFVKNSGKSYLSINLPCEKIEGAFRRIFTAKEVYNYLKEKHTCRPNGKKSAYNSVLHILSNRTYSGEYNHSGVVLEDAIPAIVSKETFAFYNYQNRHNACICRAMFLKFLLMVLALNKFPPCSLFRRRERLGDKAFDQPIKIVVHCWKFGKVGNVDT